MVSALTNYSAQTIIDEDTNNLITLANKIVNQCIGVNCHTSPLTRQQITEQLSTLAQNLAHLRMGELSIPRSDPTGRTIYNNYLALSSAVASTYNYQCNDTVPTSFLCVNSASSVMEAKNTVIETLTPAVDNRSQTAVITGVLWFGFFIFIFLFFICLILGFLWSFVQKGEPRFFPKVEETPVMEEDLIDLPT